MISDLKICDYAIIMNKYLLHQAYDSNPYYQKRSVRVTASLPPTSNPICISILKGDLDLVTHDRFLNVTHSKLNLISSLHIQVNSQCFYSC